MALLEMEGTWGNKLSLFHLFLILHKTIQVLFQLSTGLGLQSTFSAQRRKPPDYKPARASSTLEQHSL